MTYYLAIINFSKILLSFGKKVRSSDTKIQILTLAHKGIRAYKLNDIQKNFKRRQWYNLEGNNKRKANLGTNKKK